MPTTDTPLRYPGGKSQLAPFVADLLRANDLLGGVYAEPYAGGAGLALRLLFSGQVNEVWLNDIDAGIYNFWHSVLNDTDHLCEKIERTPVTIDEWHRQRGVLSGNAGSAVEIGFATLFLNRTNRSGIISGGVIGGKSQQGSYRLDCRFNRAELVAKVRRIASYGDVVKLSQLDARVCITKWAEAMPPRGLLNIDPPYYAKGHDLYTNFYKPGDHETVARVIRKLKCRWMLTYDDVPEIERLYAGLPIYRKALMYSAQVKRRANELLVLSPRLAPPASLTAPIAQAA